MAEDRAEQGSGRIRAVWLERSDFADPPPPFKTGAAGLARIGSDGEFELEERVQLSANATHALLGHGVVDALNALGPEGRVGGGLPVLFRPGLLDAARSILYEADRMTYAGEFDFLVCREEGASPCEYRLIVDNREYQVALVRLVDVFNRAVRHGEGVWLTL